jgi:hypothetical protein
MSSIIPTTWDGIRGKCTKRVAYIHQRRHNSSSHQCANGFCSCVDRGRYIYDLDVTSLLCFVWTLYIKDVKDMDPCGGEKADFL